MKMRLIVALSCLLLAAAAPAASSKDAHYTRSTAVVVRAHPWLTRGLERESLIGIRFWGGIDGQYGGPLIQPVTFRFQLKNCTREDLGELALWYLPYNQNPYSWREGLGRMAGTTGETEVSETEFTLTYTPLPDNGDTWIHPRTETRTESAYIWLTAAIDPAISRDAEIRVRVDNETIRLQDGSYAVDNNLLDDGTVAPHRVYPYKYRINAYLRADRMRGVRASDVLDDATEARLAGLTDVMLSSLKVAYDREAGSFYLDLGETYDGSGTYADGLRRLTDLRDGTNEGGGNPNLYAAPHLRVFASLDKGPFIQALNPDGTGKTEVVGYDDEGKPITKPVWEKLDSDGDGNAHEAYPLGHAAGALHRAALVDGIVEMMAACDLDGLDVDWEYPNQIRDGVSGGGNGNREFEKYGLLLRDLAEAFFNHGWELAMCTNLGYQMPHAEVMAVPDFINSMAYGGGTLNASNKVMDTAIAVLTSRNVPKRRILLGQAIFSNTSYHLGWDEIVSRLRNDQSKDYFSRLDSDTYWQAWSYNGRSGAYHTYTGPTTYRAKCNRARIEGYGGAMSWGYYSDTRWGTDDLLCLAQNQAQAIWPHDYLWLTPPKSEDDFYLLDSEKDWFWFQENSGVNVRLAGDIIFTHDPLPIASFSGTLDGNNKTITLPKDVWLCTFDNTALFQSLSGTVKNLTIVLEGRSVTRNDRKNDNAPGNTSLKLPGDGQAALLAASLGGNATLSNVTLRLAENAEVQGAKQTGLLAANVWTNQSPGVTLTNVRAEINGTVRNLADNSGDCLLDGTDSEGNRYNTLTRYSCVGGLIGWAGTPTAITLTDCAVTLASTARIANETGYDDAAAGAIGHSNTASVRINGLDVTWRDGATIVAKAPTDGLDRTPSPWVSCYYTSVAAPTSASGRILVPSAERTAFREQWPSYWLEAVAPLWLPGYRLRLH